MFAVGFPSCFSHDSVFRRCFIRDANAQRWVVDAKLPFIVSSKQSSVHLFIHICSCRPAPSHTHTHLTERSTFSNRPEQPTLAFPTAETSPVQEKLLCCSLSMSDVWNSALGQKRSDTRKTHSSAVTAETGGRGPVSRRRCVHCRREI